MSNLWHVKNWFRVGHNISWSLNFHTLFGFLYLSHPNEFYYKESLKKHEFVIKYLKRELGSVIEKYRSVREEENVPESKRIWILWWQGEDSAPELVKACIKSIKRNANGAEVTVITKDNISSFIDIPDYIFEKRKKGWVSFAQLSDIIRFLLLEKYGGLWLDSTVYTSKPIPDYIYSLNFYSQHTKWQKTCFVQHNLYHGFTIGGKAHAKLVSFCKEMFLEYWKMHDTLVDYLMIDYIIMIAYQEFEDIRSEIDSLPYSSERLYDLVHLLDKPFNDAEFNKLCNDCIFSKLDWHKKYEMEKNGKPTYYSHLIES